MAFGRVGPTPPWASLETRLKWILSFFLLFSPPPIPKSWKLELSEILLKFYQYPKIRLEYMMVKQDYSW